MLKDKRGSQFVEASLVLPLLFSIVLSLIGVLQFFFQGLQCRIEVQETVLDQASVDKGLYRVIESEKGSTLVAKGLFRGVLRDDFRAEVTVIDEGWMIRAGGLINENGS